MAGACMKPGAGGWGTAAHCWRLGVPPYSASLLRWHILLISDWRRHHGLGACACDSSIFKYPLSGLPLLTPSFTAQSAYPVPTPSSNAAYLPGSMGFHPLPPSVAVRGELWESVLSHRLGSRSETQFARLSGQASACSAIALAQALLKNV